MAKPLTSSHFSAPQLSSSLLKPHLAVFSPYFLKLYNHDFFFPHFLIINRRQTCCPPTFALPHDKLDRELIRLWAIHGTTSTTVVKILLGQHKNAFERFGYDAISCNEVPRKGIARKKREVQKESKRVAHLNFTLTFSISTSKL